MIHFGVSNQLNAPCVLPTVVPQRGYQKSSTIKHAHTVWTSALGCDYSYSCDSRFPQSIQAPIQLLESILRILVEVSTRLQPEVVPSTSSQHPSRFRPHCNRGDVMRFYVQHRLAVLTSLARSDQFSRPGIIAMSAVEPCRPDERALTHQFIFSVLTSVAGGRSSAV